MTTAKKTEGHFKEDLDQARRHIAQLEQRLAEQKIIEAQLRQNEERYRNFMENVSDECYETDLRGNITYINEIAARRSGYRRDDLIGKNNRDYTSPEEAKRTYKIFHEIYRTGTPAILTDYKLLTRDGQFRFVETSVSLIRDSAGNPTGFRGISRDLTGRRQDQTNLERYRDFMENIADGCFENDLRGTITYTNEVGARRLGLTKEEFVGMNLREFTSPGEAQRIIKFFNEIYRSGKPAFIDECELYRKDGQSLFVEMSAALIYDAQGKPVGFRGTTRDVSEKKKARKELERYRDFMETIADGCYENDLRGTITYANEIAARRIGYSREEFVGMNNRDFMTPGEARRINAIFNDVYKTGKPTFIDATEVLHKDGHTVFIEQSAAVIRDEKGNIAGFRGTTRDITERKKIQDALKESEKNYRLLIENNPAGILIYSPAGRIIMANKRALEDLETTEDRLVGKLASLTDLKLFRPDGKPLPQNEHPVMKAIIGNAPVNDVVIGVSSLQRENIVWLVVNAEPQWDEAGRLSRVIASFFNVTRRIKAEAALKSSEAKYRFLTEKMTDIVWTVDRNLNFTYVSPSIEKALGYPPEAFARLRAEDILTEESFRQVMELIVVELARNREPSPEADRFVAFETTYRHQNGSMVWFHNVASAIRDEQGVITGFHGVSRNVSDQKQAAAEREELIAELKQALAEVKTLSGMLPICAHCKKIRDDQGYWNQMETYITKHSEALFSHCICPDCATKIYPDYLPGPKK